MTQTFGEKDSFEQIVRVTPAFDKRSDDPSKNYGIGSVRITFILKGPKGAVQFMIGTDWHLPQVHEHLMQFQHNRQPKFLPDGWDVGAHAKEPMYEDQGTMKCELTGTGHCYYDGSGLMADEWVPDFVAGGTDWLWPRLEKQYYEWLDKDALTSAPQSVD